MSWRETEPKPPKQEPAYPDTRDPGTTENIPPPDRRRDPDTNPGPDDPAIPPGFTK